MGSFSLVHWMILGMMFLIPVAIVVGVVIAIVKASQAGKTPRPMQGFGAPEIVKVRCRGCGALNPEQQAHCGSCGAKL